MNVDDLFAQLQEHIRNLPPRASVIPYIKPILLMGPEDGEYCVPPAVKESIRAWEEPTPTVAQVNATRDLYAALPNPWPKLAELFDLVVTNCQLRQFLGDHVS